MRFTIRERGYIHGTYSGAGEEEAFEAHAKEAGYLSFADLKAQKSLTRDDFTCENVTEK